MRSLRVSAVLVLVLVSTLSSAPRPQESQTPTITAQTELVLVPVIARKSSEHLGGLKRENFRLLVDGKEQPIGVFEEVHAVAPTRTVTPGQFTNVRGSKAEQMTIVAIDLVNTPPLDQTYLRQEMVKFLDSAAESDEPFALIAIVHGGIRVLHDFTTNTKQLAAALRGQKVEQAAREATARTVVDAVVPCTMGGNACGDDPTIKELGPNDEVSAWMRFKTNEERFDMYLDRSARLDTLLAMQQLAQALRGLPGRKTLVWASSGVQILSGISRFSGGMVDTRGGTSVSTERITQAMDQNVYTFEMLNAANVAVYPLDARHGANASFANYDVSRSNAPLTVEQEMVRGGDNEIIGMFHQVAGATGGKPCFNRTDLANCLKEDAADSHDYYMLGFYLDKKLKKGWHKIELKLDQKADLRYRNGFLSSDFDPGKMRMTDLQLAMLSPLPYTGVAINGRFTTTEPKGDKKLAAFELVMPPDAVSINEQSGNLDFDVVAVARNNQGKEVGKVAQQVKRTLQPQQVAMIRKSGIHYTNKLELAPGSYGVWFVIRDNVSGRTGSALTTLTVQ